VIVLIKLLASSEGKTQYIDEQPLNQRCLFKVAELRQDEVATRITVLKKEN